MRTPWNIAFLVLYRHFAYDRGCGYSFYPSSILSPDICQFRPTTSVCSAFLARCIPTFLIVATVRGFTFVFSRFGAVVAVLLYTLFPEDAVGLSIFGFFFSIPCFWWAVAKPQYLSGSRFVILTYNLTCLYWWVRFDQSRLGTDLIGSYNLRQKDLSVVAVGFHRAIAVTVGILWAALVSRFWWPAEARRELSKSLSEFAITFSIYDSGRISR
jgi:hypothetical protein